MTFYTWAVHDELTVDYYILWEVRESFGEIIVDNEYFCVDSYYSLKKCRLKLNLHFLKAIFSSFIMQIMLASFKWKSIHSSHSENWKQNNSATVLELSSNDNKNNIAIVYKFLQEMRITKRYS